MPDEISVITVADLIEHKHMLATGNSAGVRSVNTYMRPGTYQRPPPRALDTQDMEAGARATLESYAQLKSHNFGPARLLVLKDATIAGQGSVVTQDGRLLRDSAAEFVAHNLPPTGFAAAGEQRFRLNDAARRVVTTPSLLIKRPWYRNYGHWLVDAAALLALLGRMRMPAEWQIVIGHQPHPKMREIVTETLAMLAPGVPVVEHPDDEIWTVGDLFYPTPVQIPPLFKHPEALACLRALVLRQQHAPAKTAARRLFVVRGGGATRQLDNEAELLDLAAARGYVPVRPERIDLAGQARLFHDADAVVGVKGAALTNLLFCATGASALVLSPGDFPDPFFWDLAGHAGVAYAELFGPVTGSGKPQGQNAFRIDPERFLALLPA